MSAPSPSPVAPGTRLGHYEVIDFLGAGAMGEVFRARDPRLGREVAVKVIAFDAPAQPDRLRRFEQEARAVAALNHPNILSVFDVGTTESGLPYVVFELLEGESLRTRMVRERVPLRKAADWAAQAARGLGAAHERGIVHRDLKPENLFVTRDGRLKVLDFGLVKLVRGEDVLDDEEGPTLSGATDAGMVVGTAGYMSPEQVRGAPADARSDIFSLGAVLYEMAAGRRAFRGETAAETMTAILKEDPPELASEDGPVPLALERIVRRCLEKRPEERFQSARDLAFALENLSGSVPSLAGRPHVPTGVRRRRALAGLALVAVVALAIATFVAGRRTAEPRVPSFQRLTFRRGAVMSARYAPDGQTVVYAASWDGDPMLRLFSTRVESPESTRLDLPDASLLGVSRSGELALALRHPFGPHQVWTGTLARVPLAGGTPRSVLDGVSGADWAADANGFAVVRTAGDRSRLEYPVGKTLFEDDGIWHPRVSPGGDRVAFFHGALGVVSSLAVVDRAGKKTDLSTGWKSTDGLAWAPGGNEVWFTASKGGAGWTQELYAVALSGRQRLLMRIPAWTMIQDIAADGRVLLALGSFRVSTSCLPPGASRERDMSWFESSRVEELSEDGKMLLFSVQGASAGPRGALYVTQTTETAAPIRLGEASLGAALSPDGRWAAVRSPQEILLLPTGAGEPRKLGTGNVTPIWIRWFGDGKRCAIVGKEPGRRRRTYSLDIESGKIEALTPEGLASVFPSPDGKELLCVDEQRQWSIFSLERRESRPAPGLGLLAGLQVAAWAADGAVYFHTVPNSADVYRLDLRTGKKTLWRRIVIVDPAGLVLGGPAQYLIAPVAGAYCYTAWWNLFDLYQVKGLD